MARLLITTLFIATMALPLCAHEFSTEKCPTDELYSQFRDPTNCRAFTICINGKKLHAKCPTGMHYDALKMRCDPPELTDCFVNETADVVNPSTSDQLSKESEDPEMSRESFEVDPLSEYKYTTVVDLDSAVDGSGSGSGAAAQARQLIPTVIPGGPWTSVPEQSGTSGLVPFTSILILVIISLLIC